MGLFNALMGNVSEMDANELREEYGPLLCQGERIECAYRLIRDKWVFTNKRIIRQDTQGLTGKKREYMTIPYGSVIRFSIETAGTFDMDSELKIWIKDCAEPLELDFGRSANITAVQMVLAQYTL